MSGILLVRSINKLLDKVLESLRDRCIDNGRKRLSQFDADPSFGLGVNGQNKITLIVATGNADDFCGVRFRCARGSHDGASDWIQN
jgi:hypothetical protein